MTAVLEAVEPTELTRVDFVPSPRSTLRFTTKHFTVRSSWEGGLSAVAFALRARQRGIRVPITMDVDDLGGGAGVDFRLLLRGVPRRGPSVKALKDFEHSHVTAASSSH